MTDSYYYCNLPPEILIKIFHFLDYYDIQCIRLCCKQWLAVTKLPEFDSMGVFKIMSCLLDNSHPAAKTILDKRIEKLYLKSIHFGNVDELFSHIGASLKILTLKLVPIKDALRLTFKYFPHLEALKVCQIKISTFINDLESLPLHAFGQLKELELTANASNVNIYILYCALHSKSLEKLRVEFTNVDKAQVLQFVDRHSHSLKSLDLRFYESVCLDSGQWESSLAKLNLIALSLQGNFCMPIFKAATMPQISLRSLDVTGSIVVDDVYLSLVAECLPELEIFILAYCGRITNQGVKQLAKLSRLKALNISSCSQVRSEGVRSIIEQSPNSTLLELHLAELDLDESTICICANKLPNLKILNLSGCCRSVTDVAIQEIFDCLRNLRELTLDHCYTFTSRGFLGLDNGASIQNLQLLQRLSLRGCKSLLDKFLILGLRLPQLKFLDISNCDRITTSGFIAVVKNCTTIEELHITLNKGVDIGICKDLLAGLKRLRRLTVNNVKDGGDISMFKNDQAQFRLATNEVTFTRYPRLSSTSA